MKVTRLAKALALACQVSMEVHESEPGRHHPIAGLIRKCLLEGGAEGVAQQIFNQPYGEFSVDFEGDLRLTWSTSEMASGGFHSNIWILDNTDRYPVTAARLKRVLEDSVFFVSTQLETLS